MDNNNFYFTWPSKLALDGWFWGKFYRIWANSSPYMVGSLWSGTSYNMQKLGYYYKGILLDEFVCNSLYLIIFFQLVKNLGSFLLRIRRIVKEIAQIYSWGQGCSMREICIFLGVVWVRLAICLVVIYFHPDHISNEFHPPAKVQKFFFLATRGSEGGWLAK